MDSGRRRRCVRAGLRRRRERPLRSARPRARVRESGAPARLAISPRQHVPPVRVDHARAHRARIPDAGGRPRRGTASRRRRVDGSTLPPQAGRSEPRPRLRRAPSAACRLPAVVLRSRLPAPRARLRARADRTAMRGTSGGPAAVPRAAAAPPRRGSAGVLAIPIHEPRRTARHRRLVAPDAPRDLPCGTLPASSGPMPAPPPSDVPVAPPAPARYVRTASIGTLFLTVFIDLLGFGLVIPFLPTLARQLGASDFVATMPGAVYSVMQFLFIP